MSEKKYDSDLIGFVDEPKRTENGDIRSWRISLSATHLEDLQKYKTEKGYVYLTLFFSRAGKPMASVYNPHSEATKEYNSGNKKEAVADDLPFWS